MLSLVAEECQALDKFQVGWWRTPPPTPTPQKTELRGEILQHLNKVGGLRGKLNILKIFFDLF